GVALHSDHVLSGNAVLPVRVAMEIVQVPVHRRLPHVVRNLQSWTSLVYSPSAAVCGSTRYPLPMLPVPTKASRPSRTATVNACCSSRSNSSSHFSLPCTRYTRPLPAEPMITSPPASSARHITASLSHDANRSTRPLALRL